MRPYLVMLADDHNSFRQGLRRILSERKDIQVIGEAGDGQELLNLFLQEARKPDLVILDIKMPNLSGIDTARRIKQIDPGVKILFLTIYDEREYLNQAMAAGAEGYLLKENVGDEIFSAIQRIQEGEVYLSPFFRRSFK